MIRDGRLTYAGTLPPVLSWRPESEIVFALTIAIVTTLLSYQAAAICVDLLFGMKRRGVARVRDLQLVLLMYAASPLAVCRNLFPRTYRAIAKGLHPTKSDATSQARSKPLVVSRLFLLLAIAPVMNIASILLTLEYDTELTFKQAKFGGLAVGVRPDLSTLQHDDLPGSASTVTMHTAWYDNPQASFVLWFPPLRVAVLDQAAESVGVENLPSIYSGTRNDSVVVQVGAESGAFTFMRIYTKRGSVRASVFGRLQHRSDFAGPVIMHQVSQEDTERLADLGASGMAELCGVSRNVIVRAHGVHRKKNQSLTEASAARIMPCNSVLGDDRSMAELKALARSTLRRVTFIDSPHIMVADLFKAVKQGKSAFKVADESLLLRRRRSYLSLPVTAIMLAGALVVRFVVGVLTRNDLMRGIGLLVRETLRVPWCESMLAFKDVKVFYGKEDEFAEVQWSAGWATSSPIGAGAGSFVAGQTSDLSELP